MVDIIGDNAFFATMYITDVPVTGDGKGDYRHENRDLADSVSNLFGGSGSVHNRGVERVVLPEVVQTYNKGLESVMTPKVYTCGGQVFIVVDEEMDYQESLSACEVGDLVDLMKDSSGKRHDICDSIYNEILGAGCIRDSLYKNYLFDINAFETQRDNGAIIEDIMTGGNGHKHLSGDTVGLDNAYSILSSTGTKRIEEISAVYNNGVKIPLICSNMVIDPNNRVITALTVSHGASAAVKHIEKDYLTLLPS